MRVIRTAVVGLGPRGKYLANMYSLKEHPGYDLRAVCDLEENNLREVRQQHGNSIACFTDMNAMLANGDIEAVIVATGDPYHTQPTIAALDAGKHVLTEKPLCQSIPDALLILKTARNSPGIFMIGFELRESSIFRLMRQLLDEGRIGNVRIGHVFDNVSMGGKRFFHDPARQRGFYKSLLLQKGTHSLDLMNWFMGSRPALVYGIGGTDFFGGKAAPELRCRDCGKLEQCPYAIKPGGLTSDYGAMMDVPDFCVWSREMNLHDHALLAVTYANGAKATFHECHFTPDYSREFWLTGTKGRMYAYYDNPGRFLIRLEYSHGEARRTEEFKPEHTGGEHGGGDNRMRYDFYRRIIANDHPLFMAESAYYSTALALCSDESMERGLPVRIPGLDE